MSRRLPFLLRCALFCGAGLLAATAQARMERRPAFRRGHHHLTTDAANGLNFTRITSAPTSRPNLKSYQTAEPVPTSPSTTSPARSTTPAARLPSGDIKTLTGNVPVDLYGTGSQLGGSISCGLLALDCLAAKTAITLTGSSQYTAQAELVNSSGNPDPIRAAMIGLKNGTALDMHDSTIIGSLVNVLLPFLTSNDCKLMGAQTCFNLAQYQSFPIGTVDPNNAQNFIDSSKGFFISMQSQNVQWRDQQDPSKLVAALAGAFPQHVAQRRWNGANQGRLRSGLHGIPRQDTCLGGLNKGC